MSDTTNNAQALLDHIASKEVGGFVSSSLKPQFDSVTGLSVFSTSAIEAEQTLISCPFDYAITPALATRGISESLQIPARTFSEWSERMRLCCYICFHWVFEQGSSRSSGLRHYKYIKSLPHPSTLRTPLHFTEDEVKLLIGTNLWGATADRKAQLEEEHDRLQATLMLVGLTWERYLTAATYISSRAFPSKLLRIPEEGSTVTSAVVTSEEEESHPVLLPGIDMFNHARAQPITWLSSKIAGPSHSSTIPALSLVTPIPLENSTQVYNNYGPKSNEEFLLAYGFVLDQNPDDVVVLRLGGLPDKVSENQKLALNRKNLDFGKRWLIKRDGEIEQGLLEVMRIILGDETPTVEQEDHISENGDDHDHEHGQWEEEMNLERTVLDLLSQMLDVKLAKLKIDIQEVEARDDVRRMCEIYRRGQIDILETAKTKLEQRIERVERLMDEGRACPCCN